MAKIAKLTLNNETVYPVTITEGIYDLTEKKWVSLILLEVTTLASGWTIAPDAENPLIFYLKDFLGNVKGTITTVLEVYLDSVSFDPETLNLIMTFNTTSGKTPLSVDLSGLTEVYVNGNGLDLVDNSFSIKIAEDSENYLSADSEGLHFNVNSMPYLSGTILSDIEYADITVNIL